MAERGQRERDRDPVALRCGYEQLREAVLSGRVDGWALGHGVLATRGIVAWITVLSDVAPASPPAAGRSESRLGASTGSSLPGAGEIGAVLAQMAFAIAA